MEAHLAFWGEAEGRYRLARQDSAGRADAPGLAEACRDGHAATAHGLLLAYASRACLENPTPESRQTLIDLTPPALWSRADREPVLAAPSDELPGVILQHLGRYENEVRPWLEALPAIECSLDERIPGRCDARRGRSGQAFQAQHAVRTMDRIEREPAIAAPCHLVPSGEESA